MSTTTYKSANDGRTQHTIYEWLNAPSNLVHEACGNRVPNRESVYNVNSETAYCDHCATGFDRPTPDAYTVADKHKVIADNTNTIPMHTWYHATFNKDWGNIAHQIEQGVHVGTMEAAFDRIIALAIDMREMVSDFYLFKVNVSVDARIHESISNDSGMSNGVFSKGDAIPYVNGYEDTGSISLLLMHGAFTVTEEPQVLTLNDLSSFHLSEMTVPLSDAAASRKGAYGTSRPF